MHNDYWCNNSFFLIFYSYDWFQTDSLVTIVIYTKQKVNISLKSEKKCVNYVPGTFLSTFLVLTYLPLTIYLNEVNTFVIPA